VSGRKALLIDRALLVASAPLLNLKAGSSSNFTTDVDAIDLSFKAKVTSVGPVVKLDASVMNVLSGAAIRVAGGSFLNVTGDLLELRNGSTLTLLNGPVLNITGNSVAKIFGAFVNFNGAGGNAINITNSLCGGPCAVLGGINVKLIGGAVASITNPIKNPGLGTIFYSANSAAAIVVDGAGSKLIISGN
jgi:hypothetical protein